MVSPAKTRTSGFSNLQNTDDGERSVGSTKRSTTRSQAKYATSQRREDDQKRLRRVIDRVRQSLEPFYRAGRSGAIPTGGVPAAETIRAFLDSATTQNDGVDLNAFRKCLYALGLAPDDTAFLLESLDRSATGVMDTRQFAATFLPVRTLHGGDKSTRPGIRRRFPGYGSGSDDNNNDSPDDKEAMAALHRKVLERVLVKHASVQDAFRQYDTGRAGVLSVAQCRVFLRDLGFVGRDAEALLRHLGRGDPQHGVSFHAFAGARAYAKPSPSPKRVAPLRGQPLYRDDDTDGSDPIEQIRLKLRQRVIGRNKSIREVFLDFDADGNGYLDHDEFRRFMAAYHFTPDETSNALAFLDQDGSGTIDYDEFANGLLFARPAKTATRPRDDDERQTRHGEYLLSVVRDKLGTVAGLRDEFRRFDSDGSGALDYQEFGAFLTQLGVKLSPRDLDALMRVVDADGSHQIEFDEFVALFGSRRGNGGDDDDDALVAVFRQYDTDRSGHLDDSELWQLLRDHGVAENEIQEALAALDGDAAGRRAVDLKRFRSIVKANGWQIGTSSSPTNSHMARRQGTNTQTGRGAKAGARGGVIAGTKPVSPQQLAARMLRDHASLEAAFREYDRDGSGELDHREFAHMAQRYGVRDERAIQKLVRALDADGSGAISLDEFVAYFQPRSPPKATAKESKALRELKQVWVEEVLSRHGSLERAFRAHDTGGRVELDYDQFRDLLAQCGLSDDRNVRALLQQVDADGSGTVSLDEFLAVFGALAKPNPKAVKHTVKTTATAKPKQPPGIQRRGLAADQAATSAARLRLLEEQWIERALEAHGSVRAAFDHFDADASGELDHDEFARLLRAFGMTRDEDIATTIRRLDLDGSGAIDFDEFATLFHEARVSHAHRALLVGDRKPPAQAASPSSTTLAPIESRRSSSETAATRQRRRLSQAARLRELELKWIARALSCHATVEAAFAEYDRDGTGALDYDAFARCMRRYGIVQDDDIARLARRLDLDGSGTIELHEFTTVFNALRCRDVGLRHEVLDDDEDAGGSDAVQSILEIERELAERIARHTRDLREAFRKFDLNGNGRLEYGEFRRVLKTHKFAEPEIRQVIRHLDRDVSGYIDYREFIAGLAGATSVATDGDGSKKHKAGSHARR